MHKNPKVAENAADVEKKVQAMDSLIKVYKKLVLLAEAELKKDQICTCETCTCKVCIWEVCTCKVCICIIPHVQFAHVSSAHREFAYVDFLHM